MFNLKRKVLFGVSVSMVLAMAIGSFALSESQTPASPQEIEAQNQNSVGANAGAFIVNGGTQGTDYEFTGTTGTDGVLKIHPQSTGTNITISNAGTTTDRIEVTSAATITLAGVNISTGTGPALQIQDDATFNVNILLADGSNNILKATANNYAGLQKNGEGDNIGTLTIGGPDSSAGTGQLQATGVEKGAGIGGGYYGSGSNITINGGIVTANGGDYSAGIGGGYNSGSNITINGGIVTANGGWSAAGIGGGHQYSGSNITISGGVVTAYGGEFGAGIGGGNGGNSSSGNSLNGDAVVLATSGGASKAALEGFGTYGKGIAFTRQTTSGVWSSAMYGDSVKITEDVEFPADLTIPTNKNVIVDDGVNLTLASNVNLTVDNGAELINDGMVPEGNTIICSGTITTKTDFYLDNGSLYSTGYQTYKTSAGVQNYNNLPNPYQLAPSNVKRFINWYYLDQSSQKVAISESVNVLLNEHSFFENSGYTITVADLENGSITPDVTEAAKDDTVTLTVTPYEGYQLKEGSLTVTDADGNEVPVTEQDGKYTFTMPGADVTVSAEFELIPEPSVDPGHGGDGNDASSKTGDSFAGIAALAILGLATTGAVLVRKRK